MSPRGKLVYMIRKTACGRGRSGNVDVRLCKTKAIRKVSPNGKPACRRPVRIGCCAR